MATTISFITERSFSKAIDEVISKTGLYQSKSEFVRDAVREKLARMLSFQKDLAAVRNSRERLQEKSVFKGNLSAAQRNKLAKSYLKSRQA